MTGVESVQPIMLQPMWITVAVQVLVLLVAAGIAYGITKAQLSSNEKEIIALRKEISEIEKDFAVWQRKRLLGVVLKEDCYQMREDCRDPLHEKIDKLSVKIDGYAKNAQTNWQNTALFIGAVCEKLDIDPPELK